MDSWRVKDKMLRQPELTSYDSIKTKIEGIESKYIKTLACLAYASGGRASELTQITKKDIYKENVEGIDYLIIRCPILKKRKKPTKDSEGKYFTEHLPSGKDVKRVYENNVEKFNPEIHYRFNLVKPPLEYSSRLVRMDEAWLVNPILEFAESSEGEKPLFAVHRATLYKKLISTLGINPHGFRKLRATHLRKLYHYDGYALKKFFGWSSLAPSEFYIGLDNADLKQVK